MMDKIRIRIWEVHDSHGNIVHRTFTEKDAIQFADSATSKFMKYTAVARWYDQSSDPCDVSSTSECRPTSRRHQSQGSGPPSLN